MTRVIDAITHNLTGAHIARSLHDHFASGESDIQLVCEAFRVKSLMATVRVNLSHIFNKEGISKENRYGLRSSEPFPYTFEDGRQGRFYCFHINQHVSAGKVMMRAVAMAMEDMSL